MNNNINNLKVGDKIFVEEAWEDTAGGYHDEPAKILSIDDKGELSLDFFNAPDDVKEFLKGSDGYMANDYKKED